MRYQFLTVISLLLIIFVIGCSSPNADKDYLKRISYISNYVSEEKDAYIYLPRGYYTDNDRKWPVILFLHGNGERGNGKDELDFVLMHGPLYEAWVQRRDLPFIIISPQLPMLGKDEESAYLRNRDPGSIPQRINAGTPERFPESVADFEMRTSHENSELFYKALDRGWETRVDDVIMILNRVLDEYKADSSRVYLTGLSYGGYGTWIIASKHPELFSAIAPVVGFGAPKLMAPIAEHKLPVWAFAGGRDTVVKKDYFFKGLNLLESLGHTEIRFTIHEDMGHDAWKRIYAGDDLYNWFLSIKKN